MTSDGDVTVVLLAAGYGTRLGRVGRTTPKALLPVPEDGRPVLAHLFEAVGALPGLTEVVLVTNRRFHDTLETWTATEAPALPADLRLLCDGTAEPEDRLGAVGDLALALERIEPTSEVLVLATDTAYDFPLSAFALAFRSRPAADVLLAVVKEPSDRLQGRGVVVLDAHERVVRFDEKPARPTSDDTALPLHLLRVASLPLVHTYLQEGGDPDAPGHFIEWLVERVRVEGWRAPGGRLDVEPPDGIIAPG